LEELILNFTIKELSNNKFSKSLTSNTRKNAMEEKIKWETEMSAALDKARTENKNILIDFFNPG